MRIHHYPVTCAVCGEEGMGTSSAARASWTDPAAIRHVDPRVCASVLARRRRELEKREGREIVARVA